MVYDGKPYLNGWFGGTTLLGNPHIPFQFLVAYTIDGWTVKHHVVGQKNKHKIGPVWKWGNPKSTVKSSCSTFSDEPITHYPLYPIVIIPTKIAVNLYDTTKNKHHFML